MPLDIRIKAITMLARIQFLGGSSIQAQQKARGQCDVRHAFQSGREMAKHMTASYS
jgi:hypothetical protein